jgi:Sulfotransferase domain
VTGMFRRVSKSRRTEGPLPTFVVIGAQKAGTTSLYEYLRAHPQVTMAHPKEVNFFAKDDLWARGLPFYRRHFREPHARAVGEISPSYAMARLYPDAAWRLALSLPEVRIVYLVRHPVHRIISAYQHHVFLGQERRDPAAAVMGNPRYLDASCYGQQLRRYLDLLPPERVLVCAAERLKVDRVATMKRILRFIGVEETIRPGSLDRVHHPSAPKRMPYGHLRGQPDRDFVERPFMPRTGVHARFRSSLPSRSPTSTHSFRPRCVGRSGSNSGRKWRRSPALSAR